MADQAHGKRSGPGDTDLVMHSLRTFMRLAVAGNPTVLLPLLAQRAAVMFENEYGIELRELTLKISPRSAIRASWDNWTDSGSG